MPQITMADDPVRAKQVLDRLEESQKPVAAPPPDADPPTDMVGELCGGYLDDRGTWVREFEVRELTGRDEEYFARIKDPSRVLISILERGLVRVGSAPSSTGLVDGLLAGDWETVLLAIRIATFGHEYKSEHKCSNCREPYETALDLRTHIGRKTVEREDIVFTVTGRHRTVYTVEHAYGSTQRKIMSAPVDTPMADANTWLLADCLLRVGDRPSLGQDDGRDLPMADRRKILDEIDKRRVGPELREVRTKCPACGNEQPSPLFVAALFQ